MSIAWFTYFIFCIVVGFLVFVIIKKDEKISFYKKEYNYRSDRYFECKRNSECLSQTITDYEKIFEDINNLLPI